MSILKSSNIGRCNFEIDLGLSVNWCACNLGANKPEEYGLYFSFGETKGYKESEISGNMFTEEWYSKLPASKIKSDLMWEDDAANEYLKGKWRVPADKEFLELKENTKQMIEVLNGIKGIRFTSINNDNSIFIPFAGRAYEGSVRFTGRGFDCWSSVLYSADRTYLLHGNSEGDDYVRSCGRFFGFSIRAVCQK